MALLTLIMGLMFLNDSSYFLYLKDGRILEVKDMPRFEGKFCYFALLDGEKSMLPSTMIDFEKTETYNLELNEQKQAEMEMNRSADEVNTQVEEKEHAKILLRRSKDLENYTPKGSANTGDVLQTDSVERGDVLGTPKVRTWKSNDDLYLSKETVSRTNSGYRVECILMVKQPSGVQNASLKLTAHLDNGEIISMEQPAQPEFIAFEQTGTVLFVINTEMLIEGITYSVRGVSP